MNQDDFDHSLTQAAAQIEAGEVIDAARSLRSAVRWSDLPQDEMRLKQLFRCVAAAADLRSLETLKQTAEKAVEMTPQTLFDLGYELIEVGLEAIAIPVLQRVNSEVPGQSSVIQELIAALESENRNGEARDLLLANPALLTDFWPCYLLCFNALSATDLETSRTYFEGLDPQTPEEQFVAYRFQAILDRAAAAESLTRLDSSDLRGWHFVFNGSLLLHLSPFGFDEGMQGRYAYVQDSPDAIHRDLKRLQAVFTHTHWQPQVIQEFPEHSSRIIARSLADLLSLPIEPFSPQPEALIVAYDLSDLHPEVLEQLEDRNEARLFVRGASWTNPPSIIPDFVGLLHQLLIAPWGETLHYTPEGGATRIPPSGEPVGIWVDRILTAKGEEDPDDPAIDPLENLLQLASLARWHPSDRWFDGPVISSKFA